MTSQSPRIYIYKITFEEVPYYYYGSKKEKRFNEEYWGSPITNKWCWQLYTPKKQILEIFDYSDEGYIKAQEVEKRLIKPFYNTDKWCLNKNCGGYISLKSIRKVALKNKENGIGLFGRTPEQHIEDSRISGLKHKENGTGIFSLTPEEKTEINRKGGTKTKENGTGLFGRNKKQISEDGRKGAEKIKKLGIGIHAQIYEERRENGKKAAKITNSQRWECLETGFITNPGNLTKYQKARDIDTSKRKRIS